jgi:hypothetical protein
MNNNNNNYMVYRPVSGQQLRKYGTVMEPLPGSGPHATVEVLLEAVFVLCGPLLGYITRPTWKRLVRINRELGSRCSLRYVR